ncbi:MAG: diguanylate cyclase [Thermovirgaceae bacterium]
MREADLLDLINRIEKVRSVPYACQAVADVLTDSVQHSSASIHLMNARCDRLDAVAYSKHPPGVFHLSKGGGFLWRVLDKGVSRIVELPCARGYQQGMPESRYALIVPVISKGTRWGLLAMETAKPEGFSEADKLFCRLIASILGNSISHMKMEERFSASLQTLSERNTQNRTLLDISLELFSSKDRSQIIENFVRSIYGNLGYDKVSLFLREVPSGPLFLAACRGKSFSMDVIDELLGGGKGLVGRVLRAGVPALSNDVTQDPDYFPDDEKTCSEMVVPIKYGETFWGVLVLDEYHKDAFRREDLQLASILCSHLAVVLDNIEFFRRLERDLDLMEALHDIVTAAASESDIVALCNRIALQLRERTKYSLVEINALVDEKTGKTRILSSSRPEAATPGFLEERSRKLWESGGGLSGQAVRTRSVVNVPDVRASENYACLDERTFSEVDIPIIFGERVYGVLCVESGKAAAFQKEDIRCLTILARHLGVLWAHYELLDRTMASSLQDPLTGQWNRRCMHEKLREEIDRTARYKTQFSIVMMDLADFKDINDHFGHTVGDKVLIEVSSFLSANLRASDSFFRYGGDEFIALLPETGREEAQVMMERIKSDMAERTWSEEKVMTIVDSGVATCPGDGTDEDSLVRIADLRLYEAKRKRKSIRAGSEGGGE